MSLAQMLAKRNIGVVELETLVGQPKARRELRRLNTCNQASPKAKNL